MKITEALASGKPCFSFEFFPPKSPEGEQALYSAIADLKDLQPTYVSVTYGAGGSTRQKTVEWVSHIKHRVGIEAMAHLTCVGHSQSELREVLNRLRDAGIENVLALRGDPPRGAAQFTPHPDGFAHASELVRFIRSNGWGFGLGGACYPEGHIECPDKAKDLEHLGEKVRAGVDFLVTQLFFDNAAYFNFVARARLAGIGLSILPGLMPITNVEQVERFTRLCGATIPASLMTELEKRRHDPAAVVELGIEHAVRQARELLSRGAPGIHFYTLNKSSSTRRVLGALRGGT
ncbi:MAG: methylenetetrahydrofolate reductase [NAD(P)H] [Planctomycetes bacterium]|nr:methylenetetrahydrofolate reductase [NAD(P)H] [Planctomycetota bacterium]